MEEWKMKLYERLGREGFLIEESMAKHTTFKTGGNAVVFLMPKNTEELIDCIQILREWNIPYLIMGNGSNLLVGDGGIRGAVIQLCRRMQEIRLDGTNMYIQSGALLTAAAATAADAGLAGLAFASGIPGTFGGAVVMNAGAYGGEMKDVLLCVEVLTKDLHISVIPAEALELSYRHSVVLEREYIVLGGTIRLKPGNAAQIRADMERLAQQRREKQPLQYPSAGSTFKRPEGYFAGKLISDAGLKGKTIGGAQVSKKHAGFLINTGNATTRDILDLIAYCQTAVQEQFGVRLETEVKIVGEL